MGRRWSRVGGRVQGQQVLTTPLHKQYVCMIPTLVMGGTVFSVIAEGCKEDTTERLGYLMDIGRALIPPAALTIHCTACLMDLHACRVWVPVWPASGHRRQRGRAAQ
jgi:hypothetical protein